MADDRDPTNINDHVKVTFEDVLAEPDGSHSLECVWLCSNCYFNCSKNCLYKLMTTLCGWYFALYWGCWFAFITFDQVWVITPLLRVCSIYTGCCQKFIGTCIGCTLAPVCETLGLVFSKISITRK